MGLAEKQDIKIKPEKKEPWTVKRLFSSPLGSAVTAVSKLFVNFFDVLLGFLVIVAGAAELLGRRLSWFFWLITILVLLSDLLERHIATLCNKEPESNYTK